MVNRTRVMMALSFLILIAFLLTGYPLQVFAQGDQMYFRLFSDPTENAFSFLVPADWNAEGGIDRGNYFNLQPSAWYKITDPTGTMWIENYAPRPPQYQFQPGGQPEGEWFPWEGAFMNLHYMTAEEYANQVILPSLSQQYGNVELVNIVPSPDIGSDPMFGYSRVSGAIASFAFDLNGIPYIEVMNIATRSLDEPTLGWEFWHANTNSITAPADKVDDLFGIYKLILSSHNLNMNWLTGILGMQIQAGQALMRAAQDNNNLFFSNLASSVPELSGFGNAILGNMEVTDPATGEMYTVPHDFQFWFKSPDGILVGTNTGSINDPNFTPLQPSG